MDQEGRSYLPQSGILLIVLPSYDKEKCNPLTQKCS